MCACSIVSDSETLWTVAHQAPPPMRFSRQEYWSEPTKHNVKKQVIQIHYFVGEDEKEGGEIPKKEKQVLP